MTINSCDELPDGLLEEHGNVTLAVDIMYINKIPFMMTISRAIHFGTAEMIKNEKMTTNMTSLKQIIEQELQDNIYTTVDDMNTIHEMNTAQLYVDPETGEDTRDSELPIEELPVKNSLQRHNYNLRLRPTRPNTIYNMYSITQSGSTQMKLASHTHT